MYVIFALRLPLKRDKNHMVSQMAHAKNLGEPFMAYLENLYNIHCSLYKQLKQFLIKNAQFKKVGAVSYIFHMPPLLHINTCTSLLFHCIFILM